MSEQRPWVGRTESDPMSATIIKWTIRDGEWVQAPYIRDGKGDRPADNINQSKEGRK
jgi:hypothetical protein